MRLALGAAAIAAGLSLASACARGNACYVDFAGGADSNPGTAAAPFRHCPGDPRASGRAGAWRLAPGDTVVFRGGVTYEGGITCPSDEVAYDGNSQGNFGRGRAVVDGRHSRSSIKGFAAEGRHGLRFRHLEIRGFGGHGGAPWSGAETRGLFGYGIYLDQCADAAVEDCTFDDIGDWKNVPNANEAWMEGVGVDVEDSGSGIAIDRCNFTRIGRAGVMVEPRLGTRACTGIAIRHCDFHDYLRWGVRLSTGNTGCTLSGIAIEANRFHDIWQYGLNDWKGLPGDAPHVDCIIAYIGHLPPQGGQTLGTQADPILIRGNCFYNRATVERVQNAAVFLDTWGGRVVISENTFFHTLFHGNGAVFCLEGTDTGINPPPDYWVTDNRFYDTTYAVTLESERYPLDQGSIHILRNVFCKPDDGASYSVRVMDRSSAPAELDFDTYATRRPDRRIAFTPAGPVTLAGLRAGGFERHGTETDRFDLPDLSCMSTANR